jgi:carbonic anhydrase
MRTKWMALLSLVVAAFLPVSAPAQWKTPWAYEGPRGAEHWSELDPSYAPCNTGEEQSPIDIQNAERADLPVLRFDSRSAPLKYLVNNGHTIRVNYHDAPGTGNLLIVGDKRYQLTQFHFHRPSEEYIHGKPYDMVAHLMYQDSDGKVAGVAVLLRSGKPNATIQQIWDNMPRTESKVLSDFSHEEQSVPGVDINPSGLLPRDTSYYMYMGSVTAPPCTEGVTWFVLKTPLEISADQISAFAQLYPHGVRPTQPLNGRVVKESR